MEKRIKRKVSVRECARMAGVSAAHYYAVLSGSGCSLKTAKLIAKIEKVHFLHLMSPKEFDKRGRPVKVAADAEGSATPEESEPEGGV